MNTHALKLSRLLFPWLLLIIFLTGFNTLWAQQQAGAGLSPTLIEEGASPGDEIKTEIIVSNLSDQQQTYYLFKKNISGVRDNGTPIYTEEGAEVTGYEMSEWVTLNTDELTLAPGADLPVLVTIKVPENASPGSHFAGIFVTLEPPRLRSVGAGIGFEVANIISIRIDGEVTENAQIRSFSTDSYIYGKPLVKFLARVENKGNVLVRPYGPLEIENMFGKRVALMTFNESLGGVFPRAIREFNVTWEDNGPAFGRYQARLSLVYGEEGVNQKTITSVTSFWVLPLSIIKPAAIILAIVLFVSYVVVQLYVSRKVALLSQGRRVVRRRRRSSPVLLVLVVMLAVTALFLLGLLVLFA